MEAKGILYLVDAGFDKDEIDEFDEAQIKEVIRLLEAGYDKEGILEMGWD